MTGIGGPGLSLNGRGPTALAGCHQPETLELAEDSVSPPSAAFVADTLRLLARMLVVAARQQPTTNEALSATRNVEKHVDVAPEPKVVSKRH